MSPIKPSRIFRTPSWSATEERLWLPCCTILLYLRAAATICLASKILCEHGRLDVGRAGNLFDVVFATAAQADGGNSNGIVGAAKNGGGGGCRSRGGEEKVSTVHSIRYRYSTATLSHSGDFRSERLKYGRRLRPSGARQPDTVVHADEACPHEWGHGSLKGYATVGSCE